VKRKRGRKLKSLGVHSRGDIQGQVCFLVFFFQSFFLFFFLSFLFLVLLFGRGCLGRSKLKFGFLGQKKAKLKLNCFSPIIEVLLVPRVAMEIVWQWKK
jgi:hypothetical protein